MIVLIPVRMLYITLTGGLWIVYRVLLFIARLCTKVCCCKKGMTGISTPTKSGDIIQVS